MALAQAKIKEMEATLKLQNLTPIQDLTQIASSVTSSGSVQENTEETLIIKKRELQMKKDLNKKLPF